jgi:hypothetical protein
MRRDERVRRWRIEASKDTQLRVWGGVNSYYLT